MSSLWHMVTIETLPDGRFEVLCTPHGSIHTYDTWFGALIGQYAHDEEFKGPETMWETNSPHPLDS